MNMRVCFKVPYNCCRHRRRRRCVCCCFGCAALLFRNQQKCFYISFYIKTCCYLQLCYCCLWFGQLSLIISVSFNRCAFLHWCISDRLFHRVYFSLLETKRNENGLVQWNVHAFACVSIRNESKSGISRIHSYSTRDYSTQKVKRYTIDLPVLADVKSMFFPQFAWKFRRLRFSFCLCLHVFVLELALTGVSCMASVRVQNCPKIYNWWCVEMSIQTCVYGSFFSCLIKNFNEIHQKIQEEKQCKWKWNHANAFIIMPHDGFMRARRNNGISCSRMTLISFNLYSMAWNHSLTKNFVHHFNHS